MRAEEEVKRQEEEAAKKEKDEAERKEREERQRIEKEKRQKEIQELEALEADLKKQNSVAEPQGMAEFTLLFSSMVTLDSVGDGLSVEDFESTLAELQSFIDGDVLTALGDEPGQSSPVGIVFQFGSNFLQY